ncbi:acetyl-CoA carboxylase biotin carboxyl carrier protein [Butyrivibrio hungatei DSM 14810]|uniref:Acetyl-CoA carboxylase biotin carboxyl carrier protein n=1 Tax=Butyrivibrio hungatei DSM 14810 TaxID=1121132 RepID=A0A1M7T3F2_9FIRM|nr:acetyl-CoA carboxylase biotin carboxyl carrier protein subunit [Butyrivibrio hungatei]SHN65172.1 acetyl-CoA carboxylase biotin carboxyl carrier protein [Butyrivibrio hungatei DSM 14810]
MSNSLLEYSELFKNLGLTELSVEEGDFKLCLKRKVQVDPCERQMNLKVVDSVEKTADLMKPEKKSGDKVKAPLLGIFYGKVGEKEALKIGDKIKKGDVLCTIEAMKMMNEVKASKDGTIAEVLAKEGDLVEYNQDLFIIE